MHEEHGHGLEHSLFRILENTILWMLFVRILGPFRWILVFAVLYFMWCALDVLQHKESISATSGAYSFHVTESDTNTDPEDTSVNIGYRMKNQGTSNIDQLTIRGRLFDCPTAVYSTECKGVDQQVVRESMLVKPGFVKTGRLSMTFRGANPSGVFVVRIDAPKAEYQMR